MEKGNKIALVLGASGLIGKELVEILAAQKSYENIRLLVRKPLPNTPAGCETHVIDFDKMSDYHDLFAVNDIFCCLGTTIKKAKTQEAFRKVDYEYPVTAANLAKDKGVEKFLIVTAMGANSKSSFFYNRVKGDVEVSLMQLNLPSLHIFRPSLLLGDRNEFRFGEKMAEKVSKVLNIVMIGPLRPYRAIQSRTVAAAMAFVANSRKTGFHIYQSHEIDRMIGHSIWKSEKKDHD